MHTEAVEKIVAPLISRKRDINLVIGTVVNGERQVCAFDRSTGRALQKSNGDTLFEIGSITKVFTALWLATEVVDGKLALDDPLCQLSPACGNLHPALTLRHLVTHTSGLPRMPTNAKSSYRADKQNPYAAYDRNCLREYLAGYAGGPGAGSFGRISYSNLGAGLLGYILAERAGVSYERAISETICKPLGMFDTTVTLSEAQKKRLAPALTSKGNITKNWELNALAGAGALRSTVNDMMTFLEANLCAPDSVLGPAITLTHVERMQNSPAPKLALTIEAWLNKWYPKASRPSLEALRGGIGLGWFLGPTPQTDQMLHWHNGGTGGYTSYAGFNKDKGAGVVVLANDGFGLRAMLGKRSVDAIGRSLLLRF